VLAGIRSVAPVNAKGKYLVGEFTLPEGGKAMLLQNQDEEHVLWSTVSDLGDTCHSRPSIYP
jgi:hypothetical protein